MFLIYNSNGISISNACFGANETKVFVNGEQLTFDSPPIIQNGTTLVPMRAIFEALDATVDYDCATQTVTGKKGNTTITLVLNNNVADKNGQKIQLDLPAKTVNDRTMVPLRFIGESFDCNVEWDGTTQTITITSENYIDITQLDAKQIIDLFKASGDVYKRQYFVSLCNYHYL